MSIRRVATVLLAASPCGGVSAPSAEATRDPRALEVLGRMGAYQASLDRAVVRGTASADARLDSGLIVANVAEVTVTLERPGSMRLRRFDGVHAKDLYFHDAVFTLFDSETGLYGQARVPEGVDDAIAFAVDELAIDAPLLDFVRTDGFAELLGDAESVLYLTGKSRAGGVDCHQIAIRDAEVDVQLWIEEGPRPLPRRIVITSRWEGGSPRFDATMRWETETEIDRSVFAFRAPDGATRIEFLAAPADR